MANYGGANTCDNMEAVLSSEIVILNLASFSIEGVGTIDGVGTVDRVGTIDGVSLFRVSWGWRVGTIGVTGLVQSTGWYN